MATFAERLRELRNEKKMTMKDLADKLSLTEQAISMYERNERRPNFEKLEEIADFFNIDMNYLLGKSIIKNSYAHEFREITIDKLIRKIPLYDFISCGEGGFVDDNIIDFVSLPASMFSARKEYFAQYAKGDSMINANINNGDLVIFEKTSSVTNGMIGCFCIDDNTATCKRLSISNGQIILLPENPSYSPIIVSVESFKCIGKLAFVINDRREEGDK
nr:MAG TPA: repressor protein [Caudoviricetes sp.]